MKWLFGFLATLFTGVVLVGAFAIWAKDEAQRPLNIPDAGWVYELKPGSSLRQVSRELEAQGVLPSRWYLELWARWQGDRVNVRAGEYLLTTGLSTATLLTLLQSGEVIQHKLIIVEGSTVRDVLTELRRLGEAGLIRPTIDAATFADDFRAWTGEGHPEGWIYPDTYLFGRGISDKELVLAAYKRMREMLREAWTARDEDLPLKSDYEALVLASIIEKETGVAHERPLIGGVFINRLRKGMLLQTDPTVIYGMGERYEGNIRKSDLREETPYNTYVIKGLPPTPIALPGKAAIVAAVNPEATDALYFVAKGGGAHHFSRTYKEHRDAVVKYLLGGRAERYTGGSNP
ncbi:MAG: endolytic transglycosylase MltG [Thiotrichales bacterium]